MTTTINSSFWLFVMYFLGSVIVVAGMVGLSYFLGQRHSDKATGEPYESGIVSTGTARMRYDVKFYRNSMFFVIFDLEAVFILAWALVARAVGWLGYIEILVFMGVLFVALIYLSRRGALDWVSRRFHRSTSYEKDR